MDSSQPKVPMSDTVIEIPLLFLLNAVKAALISQTFLRALRWGTRKQQI